MTSQNIVYKTDQISKYFRNNRCKWDDFYPSEKWIFNRIAGPNRQMGKILDVGCAAGGLGLALTEQFSVEQYTGVEINAAVLDIAKTRKIVCSQGLGRFFGGDILKMDTLDQSGFDIVFSLSCADWNVMTMEIINDCWKRVNKGGNFVLTLRLTPDRSLIDPDESFQYIYYEDTLPENTSTLEKAPYVVLNIKEAIFLLSNLSPRPLSITAYGYWGDISATARTKYDKLVFAALSVKKSKDESAAHDTAGEFHLPANIFF